MSNGYDWGEEKPDRPMNEDPDYQREELSAQVCSDKPYAIEWTEGLRGRIWGL